MATQTTMSARHFRSIRQETTGEGLCYVAPKGERLWRSRGCSRARTTRARSDRGPTLARVIAFANQKGGVAKTTTTLNLGVALAEQGQKVLAVDLDPQGNLTMSQGWNPDDDRALDVRRARPPAADHGDHRARARSTSPSRRSTSPAPSWRCRSMIGRERALEKALAPVREEYDYILIDTPPSLGLLTINAFVAANGVIVPVQCEYLSLRGLVQLENTLAMIRENLNPTGRDPGDPADDVRQAPAALARGGRDPARELRRPRLQHEDPQDRPLRGGAGEGAVGARRTTRPARPPSMYRDLAKEVLNGAKARQHA